MKARRVIESASNFDAATPWTHPSALDFSRACIDVIDAIV